MTSSRPPLGLYQWVVSYSGDALHQPSTGACADASEQVGVVSTLLTKTADAPSVSAGEPIGFTITLTNPGPLPANGVTLTDPLPAASGVDWTIADQQGPATCTIAGAPPSETLGCGTFTLEAGQSQTVHVTSPTAPDACGTVTNTATTALDAVGATATIAVICPSSISSTPSHASGPVGLAVHDTAVVASSGQAPPTGAVSFAIYAPGDTQCSNNLVAGVASFQNVPLTAGQASSPDFVTTQAGVYQWIATYSGDAVHTGSAGTCGDRTEQVVITAIVSPPIQIPLPPIPTAPPPASLPATGSSPFSMLIVGLAFVGLGGTLLSTTTRVGRRNMRRRRI